MTFQKFASAISKHEGKKSPVKIGDIREILSVIIDINAQGNGEFSRWLAAETSKKGVVAKRLEAIEESKTDNEVDS